MTSSLYISTTEAGSGKAFISLGILELILRKTNQVCFFRPIISKQSRGHKDEDIDLIIKNFNLNLDEAEAFGLFDREANELIAKGKQDQVLEKIITKYKALEQKCDFILCEGSDYLRESSAFEFDLNCAIAKNLGCPVLILANAAQLSVEAVISEVELSLESYLKQECEVVGIVVNKAQPELVDQLQAALAQELSNTNRILGVIPYEPKLSSPRVREIAQQLEAEVLYGSDRLDSLTADYVIAAMKLEHVITRLKEDALVITPGDRNDLIVGLMQANQSANYPHLAGILLSGGMKPEPAIQTLIEGLHDPLPILSVSTDTYETSARVKQIHTSVTAADHEKIALSIKLFNEHIDLAQLEEKINTIKVKGITPKMFTYNLVQQAKSNRRHIVLPEGDDPRILQAAAVLLEKEIVDLTFLGKPEAIKSVVKKNGIQLELEWLKIINPATADKLEIYADKLYELRKHKGLTLDAAREYMLDVSYFGTMMVYTGDADGMVSGAVHTTQHTIRPALQIIKTKPGFSVVSSVFLMCLADRVLVYGDCAVNPNPTAEQLAEIAISSADTAQAFGIEPKVALLSYSSGSSGKGAEVEKVRLATQIAQAKRPDLKLEGPIQYDAAVDLSVGAQKMPGSEVAGVASVLVFPDLNTGNNTYKAVQRETGAIAIGPILQGLKKPVNDLSRGCTVEDIINTVVITAIQTQSN